MKRFRRIAAAVGLAAATVAGAVIVQTSPATADGAAFANGKHPVLFVHGFSRSGSDWNTMKQAFRSAGYSDGQLTAISYNTYTQSNVTTANMLAQKVGQILASTGASKVDIVSHSMGSLNSRYCVKFAGCAGKVDDWVSLAGANKGTNIARFCTFYITCREMVPGSSVLDKLNSGSALPTGVDGTVLWTRDDRVIQPPTNSVLDGLRNIEVTGVTHLNIMNNQNVIGTVLKTVG